MKCVSLLGAIGKNAHKGPKRAQRDITAVQSMFFLCGFLCGLFSRFRFPQVGCADSCAGLFSKSAQGPKKALDITFSAIMSGVGTCLERADPLALER